MRSTDIIRKYTAGEATLEETNAALKEYKTGLQLNPEKNVIHADEVGRFGLLDTGTGSLDKVEVKDGHLVNADCGEMFALCMFAGKTYTVKGTALVEE